jgi:hypothetical protein
MRILSNMVTIKEIQLGTRVRIAGGAALHAAGEFQPEPGQMLWAGKESYVTDYRHSPDGRAMYALKGAPGLWLADWIDPI